MLKRTKKRIEDLEASNQSLRRVQEAMFKAYESINEELINSKLSCCSCNNTVDIKIKYINKDIDKLTYIDGKSDWIDLRSSVDLKIKKGESGCIKLGVAMQLPNGYEAYVDPRSSTFKNFKILVSNSQGIIDESYCGNNDEWGLMYYAVGDTEIHVNDRICQFRIQKHQPKINFIEVEELEGKDRGGWGSTGIK